jgi:hypothetical protein
MAPGTIVPIDCSIRSMVWGGTTLVSATTHTMAGTSARRK